MSTNAPHTHDPATYGTQVTKPPDFDAFWQDVLAQTARIPLNATLTPAPMRSTSAVEVFEAHYDGHAHDGNRYAHEAIINAFFREHLQPISRGGSA